MFALFAGEEYEYPGGGWADFVGAFASLEEALAAFNEEDFGWGHVVNLESRKVVFEK